MPMLNSYRPLIVATVAVIEFWLLYKFQTQVRLYASTFDSLEFFKGLGTILATSPVAFLLWAWRDQDKQLELKNDLARLKNENEKAVLERTILQGEATLARERLENSALHAEISQLKGALNEMTNYRDARENGRQEIAEALRCLKESHIVAFLLNYYEDGEFTTQVTAGETGSLIENFKAWGTPALAKNLRNLLLTPWGQEQLVSFLEDSPEFPSYALQILSEEELPEYTPWTGQN